MSIELSTTLQQSQDKHFAEAIVLDGEITRYDMVEFDRGF